MVRKKVLYLDTNIFIDALKDRNNVFGDNIGGFSLKLVDKILACKYNVLVSSWTLKELEKTIGLESTNMFFSLIKKKTTFKSYSEEELFLAKKRSSHFQDALHIIIAEREKVDFIVTRNVDDFVNIGTFIPVKKPEDLL